VTFVISAIVFIPQFFNFAPLYRQDFYPIEPLTVPQILLLVVIAQATFPLIYFMSNIYRWVRKAIKLVVNKVADLQ
jgi:cation-transporting P-type ATPase E